MGMAASAEIEAAPPAMLPVWTMPGMEPGRPVTAGPSKDGDLDERVRLEMAGLGFSGTLATRAEHRYLRPLVPGDLLSCVSRFVSVSDRRHTSLGDGYFLSYESTYTDEHDAPVGTLSTTLVHFRPHAQITPLAQPLSPRPMERDAPAPPYEIRRGARFDRHRIPLSPTLIVAGAVATRDFYPVHHDRDFARAHGSPDILLNIPTTSGLVARIISEWAAGSRLMALTIRLRGSAHPYQNLDFEGEVIASSGTTARISVTARTSASAVHAEAIADVVLV